MNPTPSSEDHKNYIIKVYLLGEESGWRDLGKGYLHIQKLWNSKTELEEDTVEIFLTEPCENTEKLAEKLEGLKKNVPKDLKDTFLLRSAVKKDNEYEKQTDKIITWVDKDLNEELALSFLDTVACNETWRLICNAIGKNPHQDQNVELKDLENLVFPTIHNLDLVISELQSKIDWMVKAILEKPGFLKKLKEVFETLEDLEQIEELNKVYKIFKMLVFSNDVILLELMMNDLFYETLFGAFEYDEENVGQFKRYYRGFLRDEAKMHVFEDFLSKEMEKKVRINFRLSYLRDTVLASKVDESLLTTLNTMLYYNSFEIIYYILSEKKFFTILKLLQGSNDLKSLLNDLISQTSFLSQSLSVYVSFPNSILLRSKLLENMLFLAQYNPDRVLAFFLSKNPQIKSFFASFKQSFLLCEDEGFEIQSCEFIIFLLDPLHDKKTEICELIYEELMSPLFHCLDADLRKNKIIIENSNTNANENNQIQDETNSKNNDLLADGSMNKKDSNPVWAQYFIEIVVFCVKTHGFRVRQFLIQNKVFYVMMKLIKLRRKALNLAIVKLFKAVLSSNDEVLVKYVQNNGFILELSELLFEKKELFELIYRQNLKKFIKSICENEPFRQKVDQNPSLKSFFSKIFSRYEQYKEEDPFSQMKSNNNVNNEKIINENDMKESKNLEELAYFESENNENTPEQKNDKTEVFNKEEFKEKKEQLLVLQDKIKRKLEKPEDEGPLVKKVHLSPETPKKPGFFGKIDIVFQDKTS